MKVDPVKVAVWGYGSMGSGMAGLVSRKAGAELVAIIDADPVKVGTAGAGGVVVAADARRALAQTRPNVVLLATSSFLADVVGPIETALAAGAHVITIAEEMSEPWAADERLADRIDEAARRAGRTVLGTGVNPGFILDTLIIALTAVCQDVTRIEAHRINDLSPYGPTVLSTQGVGTTLEEFERGIREGKIFGHIGFPQSARLIARAVGWELDEVKEERVPIVSRTRRAARHVTVLPGQVAGCEHRVVGRGGGRDLIRLVHPQQVLPGAEGVATEDHVHIQGTPEIDLTIRPEVPGGVATQAIAVNMIPKVMTARAGLLTMIDLPVPAAVLGDVRRLAEEAAREGAPGGVPERVPERVRGGVSQ